MKVRDSVCPAGTSGAASHLKDPFERMSIQATYTVRGRPPMTVPGQYAVLMVVVEVIQQVVTLAIEQGHHYWGCVLATEVDALTCAFGLEQLGCGAFCIVLYAQSHTPRLGRLRSLISSSFFFAISAVLQTLIDSDAGVVLEA